ncbi:uncharacterized protein FFB14_15293 [Fusarium fujikuroi]|nr:uncharacterized protein FFB14_15293 [Fusarium fujikuroi]
MAATDSARKSTAVDDPAPRSNAPFGYTARNICTFSNIAEPIRFSDDENGSPIHRLYPAAVLDFAHVPQLVLKASLNNFRSSASDCICWRVNRSADNPHTFVPMQAATPVLPTFATDMDALEAPEVAYLQITKPDEKKRGTKYSIPPSKAF